MIVDSLVGKGRYMIFLGILLLVSSCSMKYGNLKYQRVPVNPELVDTIPPESLRTMVRHVIQPLPHYKKACQIDLSKNTVRMNSVPNRDIPFSELSLMVNGGLVVGEKTPKVWTFLFTQSTDYCTIPLKGINLEDESLPMNDPETRKKLALLGNGLFGLGVKVEEKYRKPPAGNYLKEQVAAFTSKNEELTLPNGDRYSGGTLFGKPDGPGVMHFADGRRFQGIFKNGAIQGEGTLYLADGTVVTSQFNAEGTARGRTFWHKPNGEKWEIDTPDGTLSGKGTQTLADGSSYQGSFTNEIKNGPFTYTLADGRDFSQQWDQGKKVFEIPGQQTIAHFRQNPFCGLTHDQWIYFDGHCENNLAQGKGFAVDESSQWIAYGDFNQGDFVRGQMRSISGEVFQGEWQGFKLHGEGSHSINGTLKYQGQWQAGERHGQGACPIKDVMESCEFDQGKRVDEIYLARLEAKKQAKFEEECNRSLGYLERSDQKIVDLAEKKLCRSDIKTMQEMVGKYRKAIRESTPYLRYKYTNVAHEDLDYFDRCINKQEKKLSELLKKSRKEQANLVKKQCINATDEKAFNETRAQLKKAVNQQLDRLNDLFDQTEKAVAKLDEVERRNTNRLEGVAERESAELRRRLSSSDDWLYKESSSVGLASKLMKEQYENNRKRQQQMHNRRTGSAPTSSGQSNTSRPKVDPFAKLAAKCEAAGNQWIPSTRYCQVNLNRTIKIEVPEAFCYNRQQQRTTCNDRGVASRGGSGSFTGSSGGSSGSGAGGSLSSSVSGGGSASDPLQEFAPSSGGSSRTGNSGSGTGSQNGSGGLGASDNGNGGSGGGSQVEAAQYDSHIQVTTAEADTFYKMDTALDLAATDARNQAHDICSRREMKLTRSSGFRTTKKCREAEGKWNKGQFKCTTQWNFTCTPR